MSSWRRILVLGFLAWFVPFLVAFVAFPVRQSARPLFESIMAVTVTATAVTLGLAHLRRLEGGFVREALLAGSVWLAACILIDAPLMLLGGPMRMTLGEYMADVGLTYVSIPVATLGLGIASARPGRRDRAPEDGR